MSHRSNQKGFATLEVLLIVIILVLIGFIGWYVWHAKQMTSKTFDAATQTATSSVDNVNPYYQSRLKQYQECLNGSGKLDMHAPVCVGADGSAVYKPLPDPRGTSKTIRIAQWNVQVFYSGSQQLDVSVSSDGHYAYFNDNKTLALDSSCHDETGSILRLGPTDNVGEGTDHKPVTNSDWQAQSHFPQTPTDISTYVNGFYYIYVGPQASCSTKDSAIERQMLDANIVKSFVPRLQAIPSKS